jgi:hypothetical protein
MPRYSTVLTPHSANASSPTALGTRSVKTRWEYPLSCDFGQALVANRTIFGRRAVCRPESSTVKRHFSQCQMSFFFFFPPVSLVRKLPSGHGMNTVGIVRHVGQLRCSASPMEGQLCVAWLAFTAVSCLITENTLAFTFWWASF